MSSKEGRESEDMELKPLASRSSSSSSDSDPEWRVENGESSRSSPSTLKKEFTLIVGVGFVVGGIIGSGIFISPSLVLRQSGSFGLSLVAWGTCGLIVLMGALSYAELGTMIKNSGADYAYILEAYSFKRRSPWLELLGSALAFLFTWTMVAFVRFSGNAILLLTFGKYLAQPFFSSCCDGPGIVVKILALFGLGLLTAVNCYSLRLTTQVMTLITSLKLVAVAIIVVLGAVHLISAGGFPEHMKSPFAGSTTSPFSVALAFYGVLWSYEGWTGLNYAVEEAVNVNKTLPRAIMIGIPLVATVYMLVNVAYFSVLSYEEVLSNEAVALTFGVRVLGTTGRVVIPLFVSLSTLGALNASLFSTSRLIFSCAREGLLPDVLSGLHVSYKTPIPALLFQALCSSFLILVGNIEFLIDGYSAAVWLFYSLTFSSLLIMRVTHPEVERPYKVWLFMPVVMVLVSLCLVVLPITQQPVPSLVAFGVVLLGLPVYAFFVMETPWRLRPKIFDRISECTSVTVNKVLNTKTTR